MTSAAFTSLSVPALEDTMEVSSSPAGNMLDDGDIDIDFEYDGAGVHLTDDERMLEDGDPVRPPTANDEMMDDDDNTAPEVVEEVMHDDPPHDQPDLADEELIDYDEDENYQIIEQPTFDSTAFQSTDAGFVAPTEGAPESGQVDEEITRDQQLPAVEQPDLQEQAIPPVEETATEELAPEIKAAEILTATLETSAEATAQADSGTANEVAEGEAAEFGEASVQGHEDEVQPATFDEEQHGDEQCNDNADGLKAPPNLPGTLDTTAGFVPDGPPTPTDTGLHPISITYGDYSMPLFKSRKQPDGLLKDDNLVNLALSEFMKNCRQRLQVKLGETIPEDHDIVLGFDRLGLVLVETSPCCSQTSLNEVIEVWRSLHENDSVDDVPPLPVTLTSRLKFSSTLRLLKQAATDGRGMSSFSTQSAPENEELYQEDGQEAQTAEDLAQEDDEEYAAGEEQYEDENQDAHAYTQDEQSHTEHEYQEGHEYAENAEEPEYEEDTTQYPEDGFQGEISYEGYDENEEYPDPEDFDAPEEPATRDDAGAGDGQHEGEANGQAEVQKPAETVGPDSAASSTTVRGDSTNDAAGEYDEEDLIEYSDEDLTHSPSETYADHGHDEVSTLLTEYEAEAGQDAEKPTEDFADLVTGETNKDGQGEETNLQVGSEDFLSTDLIAQTEDGLEPVGEDEDPNDADDGLIQYDDEEFNQADFVDDNQEQLEPGEDDEQFHTAFDLLEDNDDIEHDSENAAGFETGEQPIEVGHEDDIGFDDDYEEPETANPGSTNSPLGKRSFEEHAEEDELDFEEPELKKARSD